MSEEFHDFGEDLDPERVSYQEQKEDDMRAGPHDEGTREPSVEMVEAAARAMWHWAENHRPQDIDQWRHIQEKDLWREQAHAALSAALAAVPAEAVGIDDAKELLGEGIHTAFRKGVHSPQATTVWRAIERLPDGEWSAAMEWVIEALAFMGYRLYDERPERWAAPKGDET